MNDLAALGTLIRVAEDRYHIPRGQLVTDGRYQPLVSVRTLAIRIAHEAGYDARAIGYMFGMSEKNVRYSVQEGQRHMRAERGWWLYGKADLFDAWHEALERV